MHFIFISHTQTACVKLNIAIGKMFPFFSTSWDLKPEIKNKCQNSLNKICYIVKDLMICDNFRTVHSLSMHFLLFLLLLLFLRCFNFYSPARFSPLEYSWCVSSPLSMYRPISNRSIECPLKIILTCKGDIFRGMCVSAHLNLKWMCVVETDNNNRG